MLKTVNRVLLGLVGLGLFALGGGVLLGGLDLQRHWDFGMPGWGPFRGPDDVVLGTEGRTRWREEGWWWPTVIAVLAVLLALLLWWLLAQLRRRLDQVLVNSEDGTADRLNGRTLPDVIEAEAQALDGVSRAHVRLTGRPTAHVRLSLEPHTDPARTLEQLCRETLAHARESAGLEPPPVEDPTPGSPPPRRPRRLKAAFSGSSSCSACTSVWRRRRRCRRANGCSWPPGRPSW